MKELRIGQLLYPDIEVPIRETAKLESLGHRVDADELINTTSASIEANIAFFPDSPMLHNQLAWLLAKCHRRLDVALDHAKKAMALHPRHFEYLDTLAEVHFHRGDRAAAMDAARQALDSARETHRADWITLCETRLAHFESDEIESK